MEDGSRSSSSSQSGPEMALATRPRMLKDSLSLWLPVNVETVDGLETHRKRPAKCVYRIDLWQSFAIEVQATNRVS